MTTTMRKVGCLDFESILHHVALRACMNVLYGAEMNQHWLAKESGGAHHHGNVDGHQQ